MPTGDRQREKTVCPAGHEYVGGNVYIHNEKRHCRTCRRVRAATHRSEMRSAYRRWAEKNPDSARERNATRRARKTGAFVERVYRSVVFKRDHGLCGECGIAVDPANWHLDHIIPLARGGAHSYANTQVTHPLCNLKKHAKETPLCA